MLNNPDMIFHNRSQAVEKPAQELMRLKLRDPFVLAIPRGGVPVGSVVAKALGCAFDVIPLIKVPIPWNPEASYGAIATDGTIALNMSLIHRFELSEREIEMAAWKVMQEVERRAQLCRNNKPFLSLEEQSVIIVDDGLGSGYSMLAAGLPAPLLLKKFNLLTDDDVVHCLASAARASPGS